MLELLLKHNADPSAVDKAQLTPMHLAARKGATDLAQLLLDAQCDISMKDSRGKTAYTYAQANRKDEVIEMLENFALNSIQ